MSQSGIPVVSSLAQSTSDIGNALGDAVTGGNVFSSLGKIELQPLSLAGDLWHSASLGTSDKVPIVGGYTSSSHAFQEDTSNSAAAGGTLRGAAEVAALGYAGGVGLTAVGGTASAESALNSGNYAGALNAGLGGVGSAFGVSDITNALSPYTNALAKSSSAKSPIPTINNVSPGAQALYTSTGFSGASILIFVLVGTASYMLAKKKGLIK
jgi:hypothetical protein